LSYEELCHDALSGFSVQPADSDIALSALVSGTEEERRTGYIQKTLIEKLCPDLMKIPINPPRRRSPAERLRNYLSRMLRKSRPS